MTIASAFTTIVMSVGFAAPALSAAGATAASDVPNGFVNAAGATVLNDGHVDIASTLENGQLRTVIKDTATSQTPVWRDLDDTVLQVLPEARTTVPNNPAYAFLGSPGAPLWQLSHTQQQGLLWPGWSTESIPTDATTGGINWSLDDVRGPGDFILHAPSAQLGAVDILFNSRDGITDADRITIPRNTHAHGSWAFTAEGTYCLDMRRSTQLTSGTNTTDASTLTITVGTTDITGVHPGDCTQQSPGRPGELAPPPADQAGDGTPAAQEVPADSEACVPGAVVLSAGHVDYATQLIDGRTRSLVGDDTSGTKVYRDPSEVVLWLKPSSAVQLPGGYAAVGAAGSTVWQVPQSQRADLIWLGWNTESLNAGNARGTVAWSLDAVDGPGTVTVYQAGSFGELAEIALAGGGSRYDIPLGVHAHANWAFSQQGVYRLSMTQTVALAGGGTSSDTATLTVAVGDVDPLAAAGGSGTGCGSTGGPVAIDTILAENLDATTGPRSAPLPLPLPHTPPLPAPSSA
ncbi:TIGR03773 family transporter-associated surface protein, partial [Xanthomonas perforans]